MVYLLLCRLGSTDITEKIDLLVFLSRQRLLLLACTLLPYFFLTPCPGDFPVFSSFFIFLWLESKKFKRVKLENTCLFFFFEVVGLSFFAPSTTW
jgi:hypothetical protein